MRIIDSSNKIFLSEIRAMAKETFGNLIKAVIDIEREILVVGGELHADEEAWLLENGSQQKDLWGINIYPEADGVDFVEFDSMINLRPSFGNFSQGIDDSGIKEKILMIVDKLVLK